MIVKNVIEDVLPSIWPQILFVSVVAITLRCAFLFKGNKKFVLHREMLALIFIIYILCLYYILTYQDMNYGGVNLIPFKEMFRYEIGSYKFNKNVIGNILLFIPFGYFSAYYLNSRKLKTTVVVTLIVTTCAEIIQYYIGRVFDIDDIILNLVGGILGYLLFVGLSAIKDKLPKFMKSDGFLNFVLIILVILFVIFAFNIDLLKYV